MCSSCPKPLKSDLATPSNPAKSNGQHESLTQAAVIPFLCLQGRATCARQSFSRVFWNVCLFPQSTPLLLCCASLTCPTPGPQASSFALSSTRNTPSHTKSLTAWFSTTWDSRLRNASCLWCGTIVYLLSFNGKTPELLPGLSNGCTFPTPTVLVFQKKKSNIPVYMALIVAHLCQMIGSVDKFGRRWWNHQSWALVHGSAVHDRFTATSLESATISASEGLACRLSGTRTTSRRRTKQHWKGWWKTRATT